MAFFKRQFFWYTHYNSYKSGGKMNLRKLISIRKLSISALLLISSSLCAFEPEKQYRSLLIFNGQEEESVASNSTFYSTSQLFFALEQKVAPILVSSSIWFSFIERRQEFAQRACKEGTREHALLTHHNDVLTKLNHWTDILRPFSNNFVDLNRLLSQQLSDEFVDELATVREKGLTKQTSSKSLFTNFLAHLFNLDGWDFYYVSDYYFLLMPHNYLASIDDSKSIQEQNEFTKTEMKLGLKVDHCKKINNPLDAGYFSFNFQRRQEYDFIKALDKLFIRNDEVNATQNLYYWNIYFSGHGYNFQGIYSSQKVDVIADLSPTEFTEFLNFLNNIITTSLFYYTTCYGAGEHLTAPYVYHGKPLQLSYTVICNALGDVAPIGHGKLVVPPLLYEEEFVLDYYQFNEIDNSWNLRWSIPKITKTLNWKKLFKLINKCNKNDIYEQLLDARCIECLGNVNAPENISNIRRPYSDRFELCPFNDTVLKVDSSYTSLKKQQKKEIVVECEETLLLESIIVDIPVIINNASVRCLSVAPGNAAHYLERVELKKGSLQTMLDTFWPSKSIVVDKTYLIKELTCSASSDTQKESKETFYNVVICCIKNYFVRIFYQTKDGTCYSCYGHHVFEQPNAELSMPIQLYEDAAWNYKNFYDTTKNVLFTFLC
jgi:hypothetical protein